MKSKCITRAANDKNSNQAMSLALVMIKAKPIRQGNTYLIMCHRTPFIIAPICSREPDKTYSSSAMAVRLLLLHAFRLSTSNNRGKNVRLYASCDSFNPGTFGHDCPGRPRFVADHPPR